MILFVHPRTDMTLREILPMSLPALVNRLRKHTAVLGRFHDEWTKEEVEQADIILMDIHWFASIASAVALSRRFKAINPRVKIIAGGASATVFGRQIVRDSEIDYIIRGDAELPLSQLVECLIENREVRSVPNLLTREFESENWYSLTEEDLNRGDFRDISWFPSLEQGTYRLHRWSRGREYSVHPFLVAFRGCPMACDFCLGSVRRQKAVFRRRWVLRASEEVKKDLIAFSADPRLKFVGSYHDFLTMPPPEYAEQVLDRKYDINIRHEFYRLPSERAVELLVNSFNGGKICFSLDQMHATSHRLPKLDALIDRIRQVESTGRFESWVSYIEALVRKDPNYAEALKRVFKATGARPDCVDAWWDLCPTPDENGYAPDEEYQEALRPRAGYYMFNRLFRMSVYAQLVAPRMTNFALRMYSRNNFGMPVRPWNPK